MNCPNCDAPLWNAHNGDTICLHCGSRPLQEMPHQPPAGPILLDDARREMFDQADEGTSCPCCGRLVKLYKRKLHTEMALFLIKLTKAYLTHQRWYSTRELLPATTKSATDGSYLVHWGLVERAESENTAGARAGEYRPTKLGVHFACGYAQVKSHIFMLCGQLIGFSDKDVTIKDCLGTKFDYDELWAGNARRED